MRAAKMSPAALFCVPQASAFCTSKIGTLPNMRNRFSQNLIRGLGVIFLSFMMISQPGAANAESYSWGFYDVKSFKWTTQVPGYPKNIKFAQEWPQGALVAGHAAIKTPFIVSGAKTAASMALLGLADGLKTTKKIIRGVNWAFSAGLFVKDFRKFIPQGLCIGKSGKTRGKGGNLDAESRSCYVTLYDGRGWTVEETKNFNVVVASQGLASWIPHDDQGKLQYRGTTAATLRQNNYITTVEFCRARFHAKDDFAKYAGGVLDLSTFIVETFAGKQEDSHELLIGTVNRALKSGKLRCQFAYKERGLGKRIPVISDKFEVLYVETPRATHGPHVRGKRMMLQHEASGLCLGSSLGKAIVTDCNAKPSKNQSRYALFLGDNGLLYSAKGGCYSAYNKKGSIAYEASLYDSGGITVRSCGRDKQRELNNLNGFQWYLNARAYLRTSLDKGCMKIYKNRYKSGSPVVLQKDCLGKFGASHKWKAIPYTPVYVKNVGPKIAGRGAPIAGNLTVNGPGYEYAQRGESWHRPGDKVTISVKGGTGLESYTKFAKWVSSECKGQKNTCTFTVKTDRDIVAKVMSNRPFSPKHDIGFQMKLSYTAVLPPKLFQIKAGNKCLTATSVLPADPHGKRPQLSPCKKNLETQLWAAVQKKGKGHGYSTNQLELKTPLIPVAVCLHPGSGKAKGVIQSRCVSQSLPSNTSHSKWVITKAGEIRVAGRSNCIDHRRGKLSQRNCDTSKSKTWNFQSVKYTGSGWSKAKTVSLQVMHDKRCLDNTGSKSVGAQPHIYDCNDKNPNQQYDMVYASGNKFSLRNKRSGLCLSIENASKSNGVKALQVKCSGHASQHWQKRGGKNVFQLINVNSLRCLDVAGRKRGNGAKLQQWECVRGAAENQKFRVVTPAIMKEIKIAASQIYRPGLRTLQNRLSNKCIDNTGSRTKGVQAHQFKCFKGSPNQQYELIAVGGGYYQFKNRKSGLCLDVGGKSKKNGAQVNQWTCHKGENQYFRFAGKSNGWYEIRAKHSNKCLDVKGPSKADRAKLQQWECKDVAQQYFRELR